VLERGAAPASAPTLALTARELEVLRELPNLNTVDEIAEDLFVSVNTVKTHLRSLYRKLQVGSRRAAVAEARRLGLL
jgi:LuxR family maltose regulon positive regulatory protein